MYQFDQFSSGGAAALRFDAASARGLPYGGFGKKSRRARLRETVLVTDLGAGIGSRQWLRGLVTCGALCYAAFWFAPGFDPLPGAAAAPFARAQYDEARAFSIVPLAYGATTGRRMGATEAVEPLLDRPERPKLGLVATLGEDGDLEAALVRAGVAKAEASQTAALIGGAIDLDELQPGTTLDISLGRRPNRSVARPLEMVSLRASFDLRLAVKRSGKKLTLVRTAIAVDETPLRVQGYVGSSLYRSARAAGVPAKAVEAYIKAIAGQVDMSDLNSGDRFDIILEHRRAATGETETGELIFAGLDRSKGKDVRMMPWDEDGRTQWFEASGVGKESGAFMRPVPGDISSGFGLRFHPILHYTRMHKGEDFHAAYGTPIVASSAGKVVLAGRAGGYGNQVRLSHAGGLMTSYSHMSRFAVHSGETVRQGQVIGYVGATGLATGPHLHYEVYRNGVQVNPASVKFTSRAQLNGSELASFKSKLKSLLSVRVGDSTRMATSDRKGRPSA